MTYTATEVCRAAARDAAGDKLTEDEITAAFQRVADERDTLIRRGTTDQMRERLMQRVQAEIDKARIKAAMEKRIAALNVLTETRLTDAVKALRDQGLTPHEALRVLMEGAYFKGANLKGARSSAARQALAYNIKYVGKMFAEAQRQIPHIHSLLSDERFDNNVTREMMELKPGGRPGLTGDSDAQKLAKIYATYVEMSRVELNRLGAAIGKLDGWAGAQIHDDAKMIQKGEAAWIEYIHPMLDIERTFGEGTSVAEQKDILSEVYRTIITGRSGKPMELPTTGRVNPANLASSLGKERFLHFTDADSAIAYQKEYGYGTLSSGIMQHQMRAAKMAGMMETFGPNPAYMLQRMMGRLGDEIRDDPRIEPGEKQRLSAPLRFDAGTLREVFDVMSGMHSKPVNVTAATVGNEIRAAVGMAKLANVVMSSAVPDTLTTALAAQFRGGGFWHGLTSLISEMMVGLPKGEALNVSSLVGEAAEGMTQSIIVGAHAADAPVGVVSRAAETFFKFNLQTYWDRIARSASARVIAHEMGIRGQSSFHDLPDAYQHVLNLHGISPAEWDVLRQAKMTQANGRDYVTPDQMQTLADHQVAPLVQHYIESANAALAERQLGRKTKDVQEATWVFGRSMRLAGRMGRMEARIEDRLKTLGLRKDAKVQALQDRIAGIHEDLTSLAEFYDQGKGSERARAREEMGLEERIAGAKRTADRTRRDLQAAAAQIDKVTHDKIAGHLDEVDALDKAVAASSKDPAAASIKYDALEAKIRATVEALDAKKGELTGAARESSDAVARSLDELQAKLANARDSFPITKGQARRVGYDQARADIAERGLARRIKDVSAAFDEAGKGALADMHADWLEAQSELKVFTDRMERNAAARQASGVADLAAHPGRIAEIHNRARDSLELKVGGLIADETRYGMIRSDPRSLRTTTWGGSRPGTAAGEAIRFIMQFKGFPIAFTQRVLGRVAFGQRNGATSTEGLIHIATLASAMLAGGYLAMTMKDMVKGYWPPRDPTNPKTILAALQQGGGLGIYGDYLFSQQNRFGGTPVETIAGPTLATLGEILKTALVTRDYAFDKLEGGKTASPAADWIRLIQGNTPYANLFYVKPVLDVAFMNAVRDWATPGHTAKVAKQRYKEYGQSTWGSQ